MNATETKMVDSGIALKALEEFSACGGRMVTLSEAAVAVVVKWDSGRRSLHVHTFASNVPSSASFEARYQIRSCMVSRSDVSSDAKTVALAEELLAL